MLEMWKRRALQEAMYIQKIERGKGFEDAPSKEEKTSKEEGGDVYLVSSSTHANHEA
jgi:hypothetical protein